MKLHQPNAWEVLAMVHRLFKETGQLERWPAVEADMKSGDYGHLCEVAERETFGSIEVVRADDNDD